MQDFGGFGDEIAFLADKSDPYQSAAFGVLQPTAGRQHLAGESLQGAANFGSIDQWQREERIG